MLICSDPACASVWVRTTKQDCDYVLDSPAQEIIRRLLDHGAKVRVHDPKGAQRFRTEYRNLAVEVVVRPEFLSDGADAVVLRSGWRRCLAMDLAGLRNKMRSGVSVDGRNALRFEEMGRPGIAILRFPRNGTSGRK